MSYLDVSVFGLGYVGTVTSACLARAGHRVVGVDVNSQKVEMIASGQSPVAEPGLSELVADRTEAGNLNATTDPAEATRQTEVSIITVGTPCNEDGSPNIEQVLNVCQNIAEVLASGDGETHTVIIRSTVPPGTLRRCDRVFRTIASGKRVTLAFNPEFLREGSALQDFDNPPFTIIGTKASRAEAVVRNLYKTVDAPIYTVSPEVAELVKYVGNAWHATKVAFANEVGRLAASHDIDSRKVMNIIVKDKKLNISEAYLKPGFAYGGSCLPKDLSALISFSRDQSVDVPMLEAVPESNEAHIELALHKALELCSDDVGILGLTFKPGTDDLRGSPAVSLAKGLIKEGRNVKIHDPNLNPGQLTGGNLSYIRKNLPNIEELLVNETKVINNRDLVIVTHRTRKFRQTLRRAAEGTKILDLASLFDSPPSELDYHGIAW